MKNYILDRMKNYKHLLDIIKDTGKRLLSLFSIDTKKDCLTMFRFEDYGTKYEYNDYTKSTLYKVGRWIKYQVENKKIDHIDSYDKSRYLCIKNAVNLRTSRVNNIDLFIDSNNKGWIWYENNNSGEVFMQVTPTQLQAMIDILEMYRGSYC